MYDFAKLVLFVFLLIVLAACVLESQEDSLKEQSSGSSKPKVQLSVTNEVGNSETATAGQAEVETVSNEKSSGYLIRWDDINNEVEEVPEDLPPLPE